MVVVVVVAMAIVMATGAMDSVAATEVAVVAVAVRWTATTVGSLVTLRAIAAVVVVDVEVVTVIGEVVVATVIDETDLGIGILTGAVDLQIVITHESVAQTAAGTVEAHVNVALRERHIANQIGHVETDLTIARIEIEAQVDVNIQAREPRHQHGVMGEDARALDRQSLGRQAMLGRQGVRMAIVMSEQGVEAA